MNQYYARGHLNKNVYETRSETLQSSSQTTYTEVTNTLTTSRNVEFSSVSFGSVVEKI